MAPHIKKERRKKVEVQSSDSDTDNFDLNLVTAVLKKLTVSEQSLISRMSKNVPNALVSMWQSKHNHLDLSDLQFKLHGASLHKFLQYMSESFRSAHFRSEQLQEELNILEKAGVDELPLVESCEISWSHSQTWGSRNFRQWPFHALPKLMKNLRHLEVNAPVHACFIEQFKKLVSLKICDEISMTALEAIISSKVPLREWHLTGDTILQLQGIYKCKNLRSLLLNLPNFLKNTDEILRIRTLSDLKITQITDPEDTFQALTSVIHQRGYTLKGLKLNCRLKCLSTLKLNICRDLDELELINCQFNDQAMSQMNLPASQHHAGFCDCSDLTDMQLLEFIKSSPNLKDLLLVRCPKVTEDLLHSVLKVRSRENKKFPLTFKIRDCEILWNSYKKIVGFWDRKRAIINVEYLKEEYTPIENVQFMFHPSDAESEESLL